MRQTTGQGVTLSAYAYRTGKETADDGEEFLARLYAMALLKGHARKGADGRWRHGSPDGAPSPSSSSSSSATAAPREGLRRLRVRVHRGGRLIDGPHRARDHLGHRAHGGDEEFQRYHREHEEAK